MTFNGFDRAITDGHPRILPDARAVGETSSRQNVSHTERQLCTRRTDSKPVPVRVSEMHLSRPGLLDDLGIKLLGDRVDIPDPDVDERVRLSASAVFREEQSRRAMPCNRDERRERGFEPVLPLFLVAEPLVRGYGAVCVSDSQDGNRRSAPERAFGAVRETLRTGTEVG